MCWNAEASALFAVAGVGITTYAVVKKEPTALWITLAYFTGMEALQAVSYSVIDQCGLPANQRLTQLAYFHIIFQPFFFNALALHFIPDDIRRRIQGWVYGACAASALFMIWQIMPSQEWGGCAPHRAMCGPGFCTYRGDWHLAWQMPFSGFGNGFADHWFPPLRLFPHGMITYGFTTILLPILYGSWRVSVVQYLLGPILASLTTSNPDEIPAIWCLMSMWIAAVIVFSPLRRVLRVDTYILFDLMRSNGRKISL